MSARRRFLLSSEAQDDLRSIIQFTNERWGREQARRYRHLLRSGFEHLARFPELGVASPEYSHMVRTHVIGAHIVFYMPVDGGVLITRIIHQNRDPGSLK